MDQMQTMDQGTGTDQQVGGADQQAQQQYAQQQQGGQQAGTQQQQGFQVPEKFRGKSQEDIIRSYTELEKKLGRLPEMEQQLGKWREFGQAWDPVLRQAGYKPQVAAQMLEAASRAAYQRGDTQQGRQLHQQAEQQKAKAWADAITPQEQEDWLKQHTSGQIAPVQQQMQQGFQEIVERGTEYINRYMDLALRAIQKKFDNPSMDISKLLSEAVNIASGKYDPLDWAGNILSAPSQDQMRETIRKEEREKVLAEMQNQRLTTGVGAGGPSRALKPHRVQPMQPVQRPDEAMTLANAREQFANRMRKDYPDLA